MRFEKLAPAQSNFLCPISGQALHLSYFHHLFLSISSANSLHFSTSLHVLNLIQLSPSHFRGCLRHFVFPHRPPADHPPIEDVESACRLASLTLNQRHSFGGDKQALLADSDDE